MYGSGDWRNFANNAIYLQNGTRRSYYGALVGKWQVADRLVSVPVTWSWMALKCKTRRVKLFRMISVITHQPWDPHWRSYVLTYSNLLRRGKTSVLGFRHSLYPKGTGYQRAKNFMGLFTCANTVWKTVTKVCMVIKLSRFTVHHTGWGWHVPFHASALRPASPCVQGVRNPCSFPTAYTDAGGLRLK